MAPISLKIMYSDVIATIEDGVKEKVTLNDETDVSGKVETYLKEHFERKEEELEEIFILLLSYRNPPQLPVNLPCKKWRIKCESHTAYVLNLLNSIPFNCDLLDIEIDNGTFGDIVDIEQVRTAKTLSLKMSDPTMELGMTEDQIRKFKAEKLYLNSVKQ